jgi:hypothetical protein
MNINENMAEIQFKIKFNAIASGEKKSEIYNIFLGKINIQIAFWKLFTTFDCGKTNTKNFKQRIVLL